MIKRIILRNFMSHAETVIEPAKGLTVLVGPNNCGKSAVVAALQTLCSNARGDFMMRHGENECTVTVETSEDHVLKWIRKGASVSYSINGEEIHRLGGGTPESLHEHLRMPTVASSDGNEHYDIHFAEQKNPIFLLNLSGKHAATFFASSSDAALLLEMQRRHKRHVTENKSEEKRLSLELAHIEKQAAALELVAEIDKTLQAVEKLHDDISQLDAAITGLQAAVAAIRQQEKEADQLQAQCRVLEVLIAPPQLFDTLALEALTKALMQQQKFTTWENSRCNTLEELSPPPDLQDLLPLASLADKLNHETQQIHYEAARSDAVEALQPPPLLEPVEILENQCKLLRQAELEHLRCSGRTAALEPLSQPPEPADVDAAAGLLSRLNAAQAEHRAEGQKLELLQAVTAVPELADTEPTARLLSEVSDAIDEVHACEQAAGHAESELAAAADAIRRWAEANPTCPTCGAAIDAERIITGGADGCR